MKVSFLRICTIHMCTGFTCRGHTPQLLPGERGSNRLPQRISDFRRRPATMPFYSTRLIVLETSVAEDRACCS